MGEGERGLGLHAASYSSALSISSQHCRFKPSCLTSQAAQCSSKRACQPQPCSSRSREAPAETPAELCSALLPLLPAGTGSELVMAIEAAQKLEGEGKKVRVVSMPCWELFDEQTQEYK